MKKNGMVHKMYIKNSQPLEYYFTLKKDLDEPEYISINDYIGKKISFKFSGVIRCVACNKLTNKSFSQGHCFVCFRKLARCDICILRPEKCHFALGTCREPEWGEKYCMQDHFVYLANTSGIKVGITRYSQIPTRWYDQGASQALKLFSVKKRLYAGLLEVKLKEKVADKTNWRALLKSNPQQLDMKLKASELICSSGILEYIEIEEAWSHEKPKLIIDQEKVWDISYPVEEFPEKVKSINVEKDPYFTGILKGIKGQYLILDIGVINIRKYTGYQCEIELG